MTDRRYTDDEVAAIFRAAAEGSDSGTVPSGQAGGLTLPDLQAIAREVGIAPEAVALAARSLEHPLERPASRTFLGLPIAVERTVALDRRLTDAEWELLVVELREVFHARGTLRAQGSLREWSNGNLHAFLEPTPTGHRLRLGTVKGDARASVAVGAVSVGTALAMSAAAAASGTLAQAAVAIAALTAAGAALVANGTLRLPGWARLAAAARDDHGPGTGADAGPR
jgi:hypothetical protein